MFDSYPIAHLRNHNPYVQKPGVGQLKAEPTLDYNLGLTAQVPPDLVFTADAYQTDITDRVVISGQLAATKPALAPTFAGSDYAPGAVLLPTPSGGKVLVMLAVSLLLGIIVLWRRIFAPRRWFR